MIAEATPSKNMPVHSGQYTDYYTEKSGLIRVVFKAKMNQQIKLMDVETHVSILLQLTEGQKIPHLMNFLHFNNLPSPKVISHLAASKEMHDRCSAKAIVINSVAMRIIVRQYMKIIGSKYPIQVFKTEEDARAWLKRYL